MGLSVFERHKPIPLEDYLVYPVIQTKSSTAQSWIKTYLTDSSS